MVNSSVIRVMANSQKVCNFAVEYKTTAKSGCTSAMSKLAALMVIDLERDSTMFKSDLTLFSLLTRFGLHRLYQP